MIDPVSGLRWFSGGAALWCLVELSWVTARQLAELMRSFVAFRTHAYPMRPTTSRLEIAVFLRTENFIMIAVVVGLIFSVIGFLGV